MSAFGTTTRREVLAAAAAAIVPVVLHGHRAMALDSSATDVPIGPGSVLGAPHLPPGFGTTFVSRYVDANGVRLHAVIGGSGRPLLLLLAFVSLRQVPSLVLAGGAGEIRGILRAETLPG